MRCSIQLAERPHIVRIRASFTSSMKTRGEEQQFSIREEQMPVVGKGPEIDKSALIIVDMQNDFLHRDGSFSHIAHPYCVTDDRSRLLRSLASAPRVVVALCAATRLEQDGSPMWPIFNWESPTR